MRVELLLKIDDSGYPKDTGVGLFTLVTPGNPLRYNTHRSALPVSTLAHSRGPGARQAEGLQPWSRHAPLAARQSLNGQLQNIYIYIYIYIVALNISPKFSPNPFLKQLILSSPDSSHWPVRTARCSRSKRASWEILGHDKIDCFGGFGETLGKMLRATKKNKKNLSPLTVRIGSG